MTNVDRTPRNPNLLRWHSNLYLIDHGAALYAFHAPDPLDRARGTFPAIRDHVLLPRRRSIRRPTSGSRRARRPGDAPRRSSRPSGPTATRYAEFLAARLSAARVGGGGRACPRGEQPFQYAALRVVPRVERGEAVNAGVVLFCRPLRFLGARTQLDEALLAALSPKCDPAEVSALLKTIEHIAAGEPPAARSPQLPAVRALPLAGRAREHDRPAGPVHTGLTSDPQRELDKLFAKLVDADATYRRPAAPLRGR